MIWASHCGTVRAAFGRGDSFVRHRERKMKVVIVDGHVLAYIYVMGIKEPNGHRAETRGCGRRRRPFMLR